MPKETQKEPSKADTYSYKGWLNSDHFLKRAFAVYGYGLVASLIIALPFFILMIIIILVSVIFFTPLVALG